MKDDDMGFVWICSSKFARMVRVSFVLCQPMSAMYGSITITSRCVR